MKIPLLPVHILTTNSLAAEIQKGKDEIRKEKAEYKRTACRQIAELLRENFELAKKARARAQPQYKPILVNKRNSGKEV